MDRGPTLQDLRARPDEILRLAAARRADSDLDLLVQMEPGPCVVDLSELILDLEETLGRKVDVVEIRRPSRIAERIRREAVAL